MSDLELDVDKWAEEQFGSCKLGDVRRSKRAVKFAAQVAANPDGSTPDQTERWSDCKAAYRLFGEKDVTFGAVCAPHWKNTRDRAGGTWLLIGDTTELDFGIHRSVSGLGPTGNGGGSGFFLHSSLMIDPDSDEIIGLAGADLFHRTPKPKSETLRQKKNRKRESEVWGRVIDLVGAPPESTKFIHVFDAGADNYEVYCRLVEQKCGWVIRACQRHRIVYDTTDRESELGALVQRQPVLGKYQLAVRSSGADPSRIANISVRVAELRMPVPKQKTPYMKECGLDEIPMWAIEVREVNPPRHVEKPLHWVLLTSEPTKSFNQAWKIIEWYEKRPVVEGFHKCLKTGCSLEKRQYATSERLERVTGMLSVVAVRLIQLKFVARSNPDAPAKGTVPSSWLKTLQALQGKQLKTVRDFFRSLAMLGGFLARGRDGEPGWITIWRGLKKLILCIRGASAMAQ